MSYIQLGDVSVEMSLLVSKARVALAQGKMQDAALRAEWDAFSISKTWESFSDSTGPKIWALKNEMEGVYRLLTDKAMQMNGGSLPSDSDFRDVRAELGSEVSSLEKYLSDHGYYSRDSNAPILSFGIYTKFADALETGVEAVQEAAEAVKLAAARMKDFAGTPKGAAAIGLGTIALAGIGLYVVFGRK